MKFERLNSSISLNSSENPTIFMALCMIESLFKDMEETSGNDISKMDIGDEQVPTKMISLSRKLLKIYSENADEFERNRSRLDSMMEKIKEQERELAQTASVTEQLLDLRKKERELNRKLDETKKQKEDYERLVRECEQLKGEVDALNDFDLDEITQKIDRLKVEKETLSNRYSGVERELSEEQERFDSISLEYKKIEQEKAKIQSECDAIIRKLQDDRELIEKMKNQKLTAQSDADKLIEEIARIKSDLDEKIAQKDQRLAEKANYDNQLSEINSSVDSYSEEIKRLKEDIDSKKASLERQKSQIAEMNTQRDTAVYNIALCEKDYQDASTKLQKKHTELKEKKTTVDHVKEQVAVLAEALNKQIEELNKLNNDREDIKLSKIPEINKMIEDTERQKTELLGILDGLRQKKEALSAQVEQLKTDEGILSEEVDAKSKEHAELTATYTAKNEYLTELRNNIEALRGKNDREKEKQYRSQLEQEKARLEEIEKECNDLEKSIKELKNSIEVKTAEANSLKKQMEDAESHEKKVSALVHELAPLGQKELVEKVRKLNDRRIFLSETKENIDKAMKLIMESLDDTKLVPEFGFNGINETLRLCGVGLDKLQTELLNCTNNIKSSIVLEEKE